MLPVYPGRYRKSTAAASFRYSTVDPDKRKSVVGASLFVLVLRSFEEVRCESMSRLGARLLSVMNYMKGSFTRRL